MIICETLLDMKTQGLVCVGALVREVAASIGMRQKDVIEESNYSRPTIARLYAGEEPVSPMVLSNVEHILDLPRGMLEHMRNGEIAEVQAIGELPGNADLVRRALLLMGHSSQPVSDRSRRRKAD